eukprot:TRINITY_DN877_c0_g1_i1.p1 TRINITY_DN877_c0_g1~~TRINITY_DN877_c0_g1_i1.p1  ORF type:complete len:301 (-),score=48.67 TRINITY_DN877_c0_g1_i1:539-1441(-)
MSENSQAFQNEQTPEKLCVDLIEYIIHSIIEAEEISSRPAGSISSHSTHPISTHHASLEDNLIDSVDLIHQRNPIARANVEQWRCYQQANNHSCGYYALHNILTSLEWFHHKGLTTSSAPLHQLIRNGALFLKSFHRIQAQIRAIAQKKDTGFYPWREKDISSGLLEREYARMLFINPKDEVRLLPLFFSGDIKVLMNKFQDAMFEQKIIFFLLHKPRFSPFFIASHFSDHLSMETQHHCGLIFWIERNDEWGAVPHSSSLLGCYFPQVQITTISYRGSRIHARISHRSDMSLDFATLYP